MILVTGGLGMIGAHTALALVDGGHEVVVTAHHRTEVPSFLAGLVTVEPLDVTDRDAFLALAGRHDISDIVHLAGSIPGKDPVSFFRADTAGLLNALNAARTWGVRRFAVASSLGVYIGRTETRWHEELALPAVEVPHLIIAFKKAVEPLTTHSLQGSGVQPVVLRIGSIWGPLMDPESPFNHIPPYISAVLRGEEPQPLYADDGGDSCYAPDAGRAIALLMTAETLRHDTYNVSSGRPFINRELADALQAITPGLRLDLLPGRQGGPGNNPYLDTTRLTHDTGFAPTFDVATAVADYVAWRVGNPAEGAHMLDPDVRRVLDGTSIAHLATVLPDGSPHTVPLWIGTHGDHIVFLTGPGSRKARNLRRDPRMALSIAPADNPVPARCRPRAGRRMARRRRGVGDHRPAGHQVHRRALLPSARARRGRDRARAADRRCPLSSPIASSPEPEGMPGGSRPSRVGSRVPL